jgi:FMN phosphatase YigB (HAD superfamily)
MKNGEEFYIEIFSELKITPEQAIIIDDSPRILKILTNMGVQAIQSCLSRDYQPCIPDYIMSMVELPGLIDKIIDSYSG